MTRFFLSVILIYGSVHLYAFLKARSAFRFSRLTGLLVALLLLFMIFAPFLTRLSEKAGMEATAHGIGYAGYLWMGGLFLFFACSLLLDSYRILLRVTGFVLRLNTAGLRPSAKTAFFLPFLSAVMLAAYGFTEARNIRTERVVIRTAKLPPGREKLKIVQISDVHLGLIVQRGRLKRILDVVKGESPDLLVSTGDLVDGQLDSLEGLAGMLQQVDPPYGKFAVTGNHEFYAGLNQALDFTRRSGFTVLRAEGVTVGDIINLAGVDDTAGQRYGLYRDVPENRILRGLPRDRFTLLLKHRPVIDDEASGLFDLQLSGHTHKGQIFPFSLITRRYYANLSGLFHLGGEALLYVSRGSGTWGPPIRFLSPPEVTVIEVVRRGR